MLDCLIKNGSVVDGTGRAAFRANVAIVGDRIVAIGDVEEPSSRVIDAEGQIVAPGFIDIHTHYDAQLVWDSSASPSLEHGVTTVIGGNCGFGVAPSSPESADYLARMLAQVEGIPLAALQSGLSWDWSSFGDWLSRFDGHLSLNAGFVVGHSPIRRAVMGGAAIERAATESELTEMEHLLHRSIAEGGLGFSTAAAHHVDPEGNPVPSRLADGTEFRRLAAVVGEHAGTVLPLIVAGCVDDFSPDEIDLMIDMARLADRPMNWNVLGVDASNRGRYESQMRLSDAARRRGATILALVETGPPMTWYSFEDSNSRFSIFRNWPGWHDVFSLKPNERAVALARPDVRQRMKEGAASPAAGAVGAVLSQWSRLKLARTFAPENEKYLGMMIGDVAAQRGIDPFDAMMDIVVADGFRTGFIYYTRPADDPNWILRAEAWMDPRTIIGGSDAGAHLDMMCGAVSSTRLLAEGVRERGLISLEEAVHQLTGVPAAWYGLVDRGKLEPGAYADLVLFDPSAVGPEDVVFRRDLPAGAGRFYSEARGVSHVIVNGVTAIEEGQLATSEQPGRVMRSGTDTRTVRGSTAPPALTVPHRKP